MRTINLPEEAVEALLLDVLHRDLETIQNIRAEYKAGNWCHAEDVILHKKLIKALKLLINYHSVEDVFNV